VTVVTRLLLAPLALLLLVSTGAPTAAAEQDGPAADGLMCLDSPTLQGRHSYLRSLSFYLRGHGPTMDEYRELDGSDDVSEAQIDAFLAAPEFAERVIRQHRKLLWPNVSNVAVVGNTNQLAEDGSGVWYRPERAGFYRGSNQLYDGIPCLDQEAEFAEDGTIVAYEDDGGLSREGWVHVQPYWDPDLTLKVCAYDAQDATHSGNGTACSSRASLEELDCGCGPNLDYCYTSGINATLTTAMSRDIDLRVARLVGEDVPYTELFTGRTAFVNGPMVHFLRHLTGSWRDIRFDPVPFDVDHLPDIPFTAADTWEAIQLPEHHAGVLTSLVFLLRFQTNRARANRFYNAFLCRPFQPPVGGLPAADDESAAEPDLQKRAGCKFCHAILEPSAAHWGRWPERAAGYVDPETFPAYREDCFACALSNTCEDDCRRFYVTRSYTPEINAYLGFLKPYVFRRAEHEVNIEQGPSLLALQGIVTHELPMCAARTALANALGRAVLPDESEWLDEVALDFAAQGFSYRDMVKAIVTSDTFRRVR